MAERVNEIEKINSLLKYLSKKGYNEIIEIFIERKEAQIKFSPKKINLIIMNHIANI